LAVAPLATYSDIPPVLGWSVPEARIMPAVPRLFQNSNSDYVRYWPIRAVRLATVLISLITVLFCYLSGVEATGRESTGLLAGAFTAFLPQFTFRGMSVTTDASVTPAHAALLQ